MSQDTILATKLGGGACPHSVAASSTLGRLRHVPVGTAHKNRKVRLRVAGPDVRLLTDDSELI